MRQQDTITANGIMSQHLRLQAEEEDWKEAGLQQHKKDLDASRAALVDALQTRLKACLDLAEVCLAWACKALLAQCTTRESRLPAKPRLSTRCRGDSRPAWILPRFVPCMGLQGVCRSVHHWRNVKGSRAALGLADVHCDTLCEACYGFEMQATISRSRRG